MPTQNPNLASPLMVISVDTTILASIFLSTGAVHFFMAEITRFLVRFSGKRRTWYWQT
jgi:hypothetical protein